MKAAIYARVSTTDKDQNPDVQLRVLREHCSRKGWEITKEYVDQASALDIVHRTAWAQLMKDAKGRKFNSVLVYKIDRAFRSSLDAQSTMLLLKTCGINFSSYSEPVIDTDTAMGNFVFQLLAAVAELERSLIRERVNTGMAYAKERGTKSGKAIGRPIRDIPFINVCEAFRMGEKSYSEAARILTEQRGKKDKVVGPGFIWTRINREAKAQGLTQAEMVEKIMTGEA